MYLIVVISSEILLLLSLFILLFLLLFLFLFILLFIYFLKISAIFCALYWLELFDFIFQSLVLLTQFLYDLEQIFHFEVILFSMLFCILIHFLL